MGLDESVLTAGSLMPLKVLSNLVLLLVAASPAAGQVTLVGRVIDDITEYPLSYADVRILAPDGSVLHRIQTDEQGTFEAEVRRLSAVRIRAGRFGYTTNTTPLLHFDGRTFFQVEVRLDPDTILLAPLEVIAWSEIPDDAVLEGFKRRVETGLGLYITRDVVEARNPNYVTDLLREIPGLQVVGSGTGTRPVVRMTRASSRECATQIFVDGFLINKREAGAGSRPLDYRIDDVVLPSSVEGIEVYRGLSTVPPEFLNPDAECGVIAIWTRRGGIR